MTQDKAARKATLKRYYERHKEQRGALNREWYAKKVGTGYNTAKRSKRAKEDFKVDDWEWILRIYDGRCLRCGSIENIQRDHVVPVEHGGTRVLHNLQPLCGACNAYKKDNTYDFRRGTIARVLGLGWHGKGLM